MINMNPMKEAWTFLKFDTPPNYRPEAHLQSAPPASRGNDYQQPQMERDERPRDWKQAGRGGEQTHRLSTVPTPGRQHGEQTGISTTNEQRQAGRDAINPQRLPGQEGYIRKPSDPFLTEDDENDYYEGTQEYEDWNTSTGEREKFNSLPWNQ
jgi:hypothetical protein